MAKHVIVCVDCEGEHQQITRIWNVFEKHQLKVNFFFVGKTAEENKTLVREIAHAQQIDSHTYSHADLRKLPKEKQREEILRGKQVVEEIIERKTYGFRAPYHAINRATVDILNAENFVYDASVLYYRYNMRNVIELYPCWFREWTGLFEWLRLRPGFSWSIIKLLFRMLDPLVIPVHPHYSGRDMRFAAAMEDFLVFARERGSQFLDIPDYLQAKGKWRMPAADDSEMLQTGKRASDAAESP
jgi:peptidoglycan/xylan/chitin deacetylase (PgdA/CDA1 family)